MALSLVCVQFAFGIWYLHLEFVNFWFFGFEFVRDSYLSVFRIWDCEDASTQICYSEICSSSPVDVGYCRTIYFLLFCVYFLLD